MRALLDRVRATTDPDCGCEVSPDAGTLRVDASACPGGGALTDQPACRETVAIAARRHAPDRVVVDAGGFERAFDERAAALFTAAGRFAARVTDRDKRLAVRARRDPLAAAREATGRAAPSQTSRPRRDSAPSPPTSRTATLCSRTWGRRWRTRASTLRPQSRPLARRPRARDGRGGPRVRVPDGVPVYHVLPPEYDLDCTDWRLLADARERLADGSVPDGEDAPGRAVRQAADEHREVLADAAVAGRSPTSGSRPPPRWPTRRARRSRSR